MCIILVGFVIGAVVYTQSGANNDTQETKPQYMGNLNEPKVMVGTSGIVYPIKSVTGNNEGGVIVVQRKKTICQTLQQSYTLRKI